MAPSLSGWFKLEELQRDKRKACWFVCTRRWLGVYFVHRLYQQRPTDQYPTVVLLYIALSLHFNTPFFFFFRGLFFPTQSFNIYKLVVYFFSLLNMVFIHLPDPVCICKSGTFFYVAELKKEELLQRGSIEHF